MTPQSRGPRKQLSPEEKVTVLVGAGKKELEKKNYEKAGAYFRAALQISPFRKDIKELLAITLDGHSAESVTQEPEASSDSSLSMRYYRERTQPKLNLKGTLRLLLYGVVVLALIATLVLFSGDIGRLLGSIARIAQKSDPVREKADELLEMAAELETQQRYSEAIDTLQSAMSLTLDDKTAITYRLAELYHKEGNRLYHKESNFPEALQMYKQAAEYNPDAAEYVSELGWAYFMVGKRNKIGGRPSDPYFNGAISAFEKSLELDAQYLRSYSGAALSYVARNNIPKAAEMYQNIIRLAPESEEADAARRKLSSMGLKIPDVEEER